MELEDFFTFKDFIRTMLLASSLFLIVGTMYGVFIHALYSSQITSVRQDLMEIKDNMETLSHRKFTENSSILARDYRDAARKAEELISKIQPPPLTPSSYTYFNYWIASAAFTTPRITDDVKGLSTVSYTHLTLPTKA